MTHAPSDLLLRSPVGSLVGRPSGFPSSSSPHRYAACSSSAGKGGARPPDPGEG